MNRILLIVAGLLGASSLLLVDSAIKGTALLLLAAAVAMILRRDSAATRHVVWMLAIVALLAVPVLSAMLPQWRVLPQWAGISPKPIVMNTSPPSTARPNEGPVEAPRTMEPVRVAGPSAAAPQPAAEMPPPRPAPATPKSIAESPARGWNWINALPLIWVIGFSVLVLRLLAARLMLWNCQRQGTVISPSAAVGGSRGLRAVAPPFRAVGEHRAEARCHAAPKVSGDPIVTALEAACSQLGIVRPVTLLIHPDKTIPVVWGIRRCSLLLPASARQWSGEQLRSVLLHEVAHIKRRDTLAQLLTQIACALHWFNPLVWIAAWRLGVERERACDDLVLASGVRPSAYAGHLLDVVTGLSPARWTAPCGLAMARKSSIEGRLVAVLSENLNRRGVSMALASAALIVATGIAVPMSMLRAADERPAAPAQRNDSKKTKAAAKLDPKIEEKVKWGDPVNGLRAALVIRTSPDDANAGGTPDLYLLVQNVSDAPIHLNDTAAGPGLRYLTFQRDDVPQGRTKIDVPTLTDVTLGPRETAFLLMVPRPSSRGQALAAGMLKEPHMVLFGQMNIEKAPEKAWTGKLVTGLTNGAAAQIDPPASPKAADVPAAPAGQKLDPVMEQNLKWGEPVNGLRAAVVLRHSTDKPKAGEAPELYLAVENVSDAPIHLSDKNIPTDVNLRELIHKANGRTMYIMGAREPALGDLQLQPREITFLPMFDPVSKLKSPEDRTVDGHTLGQAIAEGVLKNTHETLVIRMEIAKAPPGAWTGKLVTGETTAAVAAGQPQPKDQDAGALLARWQHHARGNGNFPGGLVGRLGEKMKEFIHNNTGDPSGDPYAKKMAPLLTRIDASRDWTAAEVVALMDDIAAVTPVPLDMMLDELDARTFRTGAPLPKELADAPWGKALPNGLRLAWLLEPRAAEHRLGTPLKSRILIHNSGKNTIVFRTRTWHQVGHTARDANGAEIKEESTSWLTRAPLVPFRLWPGELVELTGPGIGVGAMKNAEDWQNSNVGSWVEAKAGDDVTIATAPVPLNDWNKEPALDGEPRWWLDLIEATLAQDLPLPTDAEERRHLVYRAGMELFGTPLSAEEINAFVADHGPNALDSLAKRLFHRPGLSAWAGPLTSGPTKFRVLPADPDAAKKPRAAGGPGSYTLADNAALVVTRRPVDERIVNEASIQFYSPDGRKLYDEKKAHEQHEIKLPDGYNTWAAAWVRGQNVLWVQQKSGIRGIDFSNPAQVKETIFEVPASFDKVPKLIRDALRAEVDVVAEPNAATQGPRPASEAPK